MLSQSESLERSEITGEFPGFGDYYETVKRFDLECDTCTLKFKVATLMLSKMR